jgi:hypothetical protein
MQLDTKMKQAFVVALKNTSSRRVTLPTGNARTSEVRRVLRALDGSQGGMKEFFQGGEAPSRGSMNHR